VTLDVVPEAPAAGEGQRSESDHRWVFHRTRRMTVARCEPAEAYRGRRGDARRVANAVAPSSWRTSASARTTPRRNSDRAKVEEPAHSDTNCCAAIRLPLWSGLVGRDTASYMRRNRLTDSRIPIRHFGFGHNLASIISVARYGQDHPEYFGSGMAFGRYAAATPATRRSPASPTPTLSG